MSKETEDSFDFLGQFVDEFDLLCDKHIRVLQKEDSDLTDVQAMALLNFAMSRSKK